MAGRPPTKPAPRFGSRLSALRKARGWTQPQLAKRLGVSVDMLTYYERRATNPSAEFVTKAAKALSISVDKLLEHDVSKSGPPSVFERRLKAIESLPDDRKKLLLPVLDAFLRDASKAA